jgi:hypothetical protein
LDWANGLQKMDTADPEIDPQDTLIELEPVLNPGIYFTRLSGHVILGVQKLIIK